MPAISPAQTSFAGGELSPSARGQFTSELYAKGLAFCENWEVRPQGPLRRRAGTRYAAAEPGVQRLIPFRLAGAEADYILALSPSKMRIYSKANGLESFAPNLLENGSFDANLTSWVTSYALYDLGQARLTSPSQDPSWLRQTVATTAGHSLTLRFRARGQTNPHYSKVRWRINGVYGPWFYCGDEYLTFETTFEAVGAETEVHLEAYIPTGVVNGFIWFGSLWIDDVTLVDNDAAVVSEFVTPWTTDQQLAQLQYDSEPAKNRMVFVCDGIHPQTLTFTAPDTWELTDSAFLNAPASWAGANWPRTIEVGFQGRMWLGSTPQDPGRLWGSQSGDPFNFGLGTGKANEALDLYMSTKGALTWMRGQKALLVGTNVGEHSLRGSNGTIKPGDYDVQDESAYGGADGVQAVHLGDQVLFATADRREVRALNYDLRENGWLTTALTFAADHMAAGGVAELAYSPAPTPLAFARLQNGKVNACTYARGQSVVAWWRTNVGATVRAATVARSPEGGELWVAVERPGGTFIEWMPLHEIDRTYLDSSVIGAVQGGAISGLDHLEGETVTVIVNGALFDTELVVQGGAVAILDEDGNPAAEDGTPTVVGLPYRSKAVTLPPEGGNPRGTAQGTKRRRPRIVVRLNDSALPLVNGQRAADRSPSSPMDAVEPLITGDVELRELGWGDGAVTIEQDLPFRTEVLALFGVEAVNQV